MPAMGDSVSEGTVLEWHKQEGDTVAADETIVEISTDKVDAEVPSPISGTVIKIYAAEGTRSPSAPCWRRSRATARRPSPTRAGGRRGHARVRRVPPTRPRRRPPAAATEADGIATKGDRQDDRHRHPAGGESVTEGTILEWSVKVGDTVKDGDTVVEISTDKVDMELPRPPPGRSPRSSPRTANGHGRAGDRADDQAPSRGAGASAPAPSAPDTKPRRDVDDADGDGANISRSPGGRRRARGSTSAGVERDRPRRADNQGRRAGGSRERRGRDSRTQQAARGPPP